MELGLCRGASAAGKRGRGFTLALPRPVQRQVLNPILIWILPYSGFHSSLHHNSLCPLPEQLQFPGTVPMEQDSV